MTEYVSEVYVEKITKYIDHNVIVVAICNPEHIVNYTPECSRVNEIVIHSKVNCFGFVRVNA